MGFEDNIRISFQRAKSEISALNMRIDRLESSLDEIKNTLNQLLNDKKQHKIPKTKEFNVLEPPKPKTQESSIGNEGVPLRHCDDKLPTDRQTTDRQQTDKIENLNDIQQLKQSLNSRFLSLTEAQFKVFMVIYRLEEELNNPVTYAEVAKELMISQSSIRDYVSDLLLRKIPLTKQKSPNRKVYLSIKKEFRNLKMLENLLALREKDYSQTQLTGHLRQYL
ncbi:hypothetical protein HOG16_03210 [Candidatus Woesearchaeota archaeon]|nr:hypothetical protein [Candidatus Woesearchaeota archaeon]